jgi:hypothetical protein
MKTQVQQEKTHPTHILPSQIPAWQHLPAPQREDLIRILALMLVKYQAKKGVQHDD